MEREVAAYQARLPWVDVCIAMPLNDSSVALRLADGAFSLGWCYGERGWVFGPYDKRGDVIKWAFTSPAHKV
jgi:hypothetical protein